MDNRKVVESKGLVSCYLKLEAFFGLKFEAVQSVCSWTCGHVGAYTQVGSWPDKPQ